MIIQPYKCGDSSLIKSLLDPEKDILSGDFNKTRAELTAGAGSSILVAREGANVAGVIFSSHNPFISLSYNLVLSPDYMGSSCGERLINEAEKVIKTRGSTMIIAHTLRPEIAKLYEESGYEGNIPCLTKRLGV